MDTTDAAAPEAASEEPATKKARTEEPDTEPAAAPAPAAAAPAPAVPPKAPPPKRKRTTHVISFRGVRCDYDALVTRMARDQWDTEERHRDDGKGSIDRRYTRAGDTKVYRSMLEVARAHYPELLTEAAAPAPAPEPLFAVGVRVEARFEGGDEWFGVLVVVPLHVVAVREGERWY